MQKIFSKGSSAVRSILLMLVDAASLLAASMFYLAVYSYTHVYSTEHLTTTLLFGGVLFLCMLAVRLVSRLYSCVWRYANANSYVRMILSDAFGTLLGVVVLKTAAVSLYPSFWQTVSVSMMFCFLSLVTRLTYQILYQRTNRRNDPHRIRVAIIGAGQIGCLLADELLLNPDANYKPVCFVDNDHSKIGNRIRELPVYREDDKVIGRLKGEGIQEIFIALPSVSGDRMLEIMKFYGRTGCRIKVYGLPADMDRTAVKTGKRIVREVRIDDLLFRDTVAAKNGAWDDFYRGKTVLVTGGGGSIGSELCRQIASCGPKKLVILDIYENGAYDIQQELLGIYGGELDVCVEIASVRDKKRLDAVFETYKPQVVFHAAAHKHVPLMEHSSAEAVKNNVLGTFNTVEAAERYGAEKFIMISTDKAVNPTNIMGASKRMCEMIVQSRTGSKTVFSCVRFGNVLGSNGSVIPLFRRQIANGGPVTVTDKRIIRYFMTIPEAAQLVMTAGKMAKSGELFVLDMGKPVKIIDLAENMIRLSGFEPYRDIDICEIGLRPGEKLYEELLIKNENLDKTENDMIFIERDRPLPREEILHKLELLTKAVDAAEESRDYSLVKTAMKEAVPTFRDPSEVNAEAEQTEEMKAVTVSN